MKPNYARRRFEIVLTRRVRAATGGTTLAYTPFNHRRWIHHGRLTRRLRNRFKPLWNQQQSLFFQRWPDSRFMQHWPVFQRRYSTVTQITMVRRIEAETRGWSA